MSWRSSFAGAILRSALVINAATAVSTYNGSDITSFQMLEQPFPYYFPAQENPTDLFPMPPCNGLTLEEATIDQLQDAMNHGNLTSSELVMCYLQRIYQTDSYIKYVISSSVFPALLHFLSLLMQWSLAKAC